MISLNDLEWAAGFLEAEGCFHFSKSKHLNVSAGQVQKEPLEKLHKLFGGYLTLSKDDRPNHSDVHKWSAVHSRAAGICMTLFPLLSPKRQEEIKRALENWKIQRPLKHRTHCPRGHALSGENLYVHGGKRYCRECRTYSELVRRGLRKPEWENRHPGDTQNFQCKRGHAYVEENIYTWNGKRYCKECRSIQMGEWRQKQKTERIEATN